MAIAAARTERGFDEARLPFLLLPLAVLLVYLPAILHGGFHFDDGHHIVENPAVRTLGNVPRFFLHPELWSGEPGNRMYRPVLMATYAVDHALWGYRASGWLLTNVLLVAVNAVLVWRVALRLGLSRGAALLAGVVMGLHPAWSEVANYVSSRSESLAAMLMLLALLLHLAARERERHAAVALYAGASALAALSLMAKETTFFFFAAVGLLELLLSRGWRDRLLRGAGFAALYGAATLAVLILRSHLLGHATTPARLVEAASADPQVGAGRSILDNLVTQSRVVVLYYQTLLRPAALSVDHDVAVVVEPTGSVVAAGLVHLGIAAGAVAAAVRGLRLVPLCVGWFWLFLAPSVAVPLNVVMNEHRLYLPGIAFALLAGAFLARVATLLAARLPSPQAARLAAALPLLCFVPLTVERSLEWRSDLRLWETAVERAPGSARAQMHLGAAIHVESHALREPAERLARLDEALDRYLVADRLHPGWYDLQLNLNRAWIERGNLSRDPRDFERALAAIDRAAEIVGPEAYRPRYFRSLVLVELGRHDEALAIVEELRAGDESRTTIYDDATARILRSRARAPGRSAEAAARDRGAAAAAMDRVAEQEEREGKVDALLQVGWWHFEDGDLRRAEGYLSRALDVARRTGDIRPFLYVARFLNLVGEPGAAEFVASARKRGWVEPPDESAWVLGGPTPGVTTGTAGLGPYGL